jgi:hypothetical protein
MGGTGCVSATTLGDSIYDPFSLSIPAYRHKGAYLEEHGVNGGGGASGGAST